MAQELPKAEVWERSVDDGRTEFFVTDSGYEICSWRPGPPNSGPPEQVHLLFQVAPGAKMVLRLKSKRALDELVGLLLQYRNDVWGDAKQS